MTELAYMVREDWAQYGTAMVRQSDVIRDWLSEPPYVFAVTDVKKFTRDGRDADFEAAQFIASDGAKLTVVNITELTGLAMSGHVFDQAVVVLHPFEDRDLEALAKAVEHEAFNRLFVLIWAPSDIVRTWLDGRGAINLHTGETAETPDPLLVLAAKSMIDEQHNGLSSGRGKDAVVQLVRAFAAEGYPVDVTIWLCAYFHTGGTFRHAEQIAKLIREMRAGTKHRVSPRYRDNIVEILRDRLADSPAK